MNEKYRVRKLQKKNGKKIHLQNSNNFIVQLIISQLFVLQTAGRKEKKIFNYFASYLLYFYYRVNF